MSRRRRLYHSLAISLALVLSTACNERRFPTEPADPESSFLQISTANGADELPADGFSTLEITAKISASAVRPTRVARFRTTNGTFVGAASASPTQVDASFDSAGRAVALLRSSSVSGPSIVTAQVIEGSNALSPVSELRLEFVVPDATGLRFVAAPGSVPADGATATRYTVRVPDSTPLDQRTVSFATTLGSFDRATDRDITVNAGPDGLASVFLYSPSDDGIGELSATLGVFRVETVIAFRLAPAETILVEAPASVPINGSMNVTVRLFRSIGTPTQGTVVTLVAFDSRGDRFGSFRNVTRSSLEGVVTAVFEPANTGTIGPGCRIQATAEGSSAVGTATFELKPVPPP